MNTKKIVNNCKKKRAALHNLGCKVNAYETEAMGKMLSDAGYDIVSFSEEADVYVINTCTVTHTADQKSRQMISRARKKNPDATVVATGCFVESSKKRPEHADIAIGNNRKAELLKLIEEYEKSREPIEVFTDDNLKDKTFEPLRLSDTADHTRAFLKVQDGCNRFCSYCIIPFARGPVRSRAVLDVMDEAKALTKKGFKEIVLTGIHLSSYLDEGHDNADLSDLIKALSVNPEIKRIRLSSLEPGIITRDFMEKVKDVEAFCPHFHLALQSGCDETLKRMNRRYTTAEYKAACDLIREYYPDAAITTDVIVGFPGETDEEFEKTRNFIKEIGFYELHVFKYSKRKGTKAYDMKDQVDENKKNERSRELISIGKELAKEYRKKLMGSKEEILTEEPENINGTEYYTGVTKHYVKMAVPAEGRERNVFYGGKVKEFLTEDILLLQT